MESSAAAEAGPVVELDHAIGYSGKIIRGVWMHPNGKEYVLIAGASIVVGDLNDPHNQSFLRGHDDQITCLAVSNNGKLLASGQRGDNSDILVWDYEQRKATFRLSEHDYEVTCLDFSDDDRLLISTGSQLDGKMFLWDTSNGCIVASIRLIPDILSDSPRCLKFGGMVKDLKLRPTTNYQFASSGSKKLLLWSLDPVKGALNTELISTGAFIRDYISFAFSKPTEEYLYAGTTSGDFVCFQIKNKIMVFTQSVCAQGILCIQAVTHDKICIGGGDGTLALFHVEDKFCQELLKITLPGAISGLSPSLDGIQLLVATDRGFIYRVRTSDFSNMIFAENHVDAVVDVNYQTGVSDKFATCSEDTTIRLWDANDYSVFARCTVLAGGHPTCSTFTDVVVISGWSDGRVRTFRLDNSQLLWQIDNAHKNGVSALHLSYNQKFLATGGAEGECRVWEIRSRELISHLKEHSSRVTKVEVFQDDVHMLSCARDRAILCWDLKNEKRISNHTQRMGGINSFSMMAADQNKVISVGQERKITFWDLTKANALYVGESSPYVGENDELFSVSISPDGRFFATGGQLGVLRVWDLQTFKFIKECKGHSNTIMCVQFSPDSKQIISTGRDGLVLVADRA